MRAGGACQRGVALVEFAFVVIFAFTLITATIGFGRLAWQYNVMQKAGHDAARLAAALAPQQMRQPAEASAARNAARLVLNQAAAAAGLVLTQDEILISCQPASCSTLLPPQSLTVTLPLTLSLQQALGPLLPFALDWYPGGALELNLTATVPYGG